MSSKKRLDLVLVQKGLVQSRQRARALIMSAKVQVNGRIVDKPGAAVAETDEIVVQIPDHPYVSRGGLKLENALAATGVAVNGRVCLDVGASTGGFTDCLLRHGAARVFAVDVGYGQFAWSLRDDPRVVLIERTNIRYLPAEALPCRVDLAVIDVSFISLKIVVPAVLKFLKPDASILALVKPQFEVGKGKVGKGGVVRDSAQHREVIQELSDFFKAAGFACESVGPSPILGPKGNREFFILLRPPDRPAPRDLS